MLDIKTLLSIQEEYGKIRRMIDLIKVLPYLIQHHVAMMISIAPRRKHWSECIPEASASRDHGTRFLDHQSINRKDCI